MMKGIYMIIAASVLITAGSIFWIGHSFGRVQGFNESQVFFDECMSNNKRLNERVYRMDTTQSTHICTDSTHGTCIHFCSCEGRLCMVHKRDYEIELLMDTVWVYDGDKLIGRYTSNWKNQMDTMLINDNL